MLIVFHSAKIRTGQSGLSDPTIEERTWKGGSKLCGFLFSRCSVNGGKKRNKNGATERMAGRNEHADMCIPCELVWKKKELFVGWRWRSTTTTAHFVCAFHPKRQHKKKRRNTNFCYKFASYPEVPPRTDESGPKPHTHCCPL